MKGKGKSSESREIISWIFSGVFFVISVLNSLLVHWVPGVCYLILSVIYLPRTNEFIKRRLGFSIPLVIKIIFGLVILWATLAVGDLAEILGL